MRTWLKLCKLEIMQRHTRTGTEPPASAHTKPLNSTIPTLIAMAKTALITGATGLLGRQVMTVFKRQEWNVVGTGFSRAEPPAILKLDLGLEAEVARIIEEVK